MHVLIIFPDEISAERRENWTAMLYRAGAHVTVVSSDADWCEADRIGKFTMAICPLPSNDTPPHLMRSLLSRYSHQVVALGGKHDPRQHRIAFDAGFDDCLDADCDEHELAGKLFRAQKGEQMRDQLSRAQKLESIGELAAGIAHEINTPIQYVGDNTRFFRQAYDDLELVIRQCQTILDSLERGENPAADVVRLREQMNTSDWDFLKTEIPSAIGQTLDGIERVSGIVRAMKEFSHPGNAERVSTNLAKAIETTLTVARNEWKYFAEIETDFDSSLPNLPCFASELNQVLLNLVVNAAQAIGESKEDAKNNSQKGKITISTRTFEGYAELRISDNGKGIAEDHVERVFEPFFTTKPIGKGTGQGLAIAYDVIVNRHGGSIDVESELGVGTTFIIRLPLQVKDGQASLADEALVETLS